MANPYGSDAGLVPILEQMAQGNATPPSALVPPPGSSEMPAAASSGGFAETLRSLSGPLAVGLAGLARNPSFQGQIFESVRQKDAQERKAKAAQVVNGLMGKITEKMAAGDLDGARQLATQAAALPEAAQYPEVAQMATQLGVKIAERQSATIEKEREKERTRQVNRRNLDMLTSAGVFPGNMKDVAGALQDSGLPLNDVIATAKELGRKYDKETIKTETGHYAFNRETQQWDRILEDPKVHIMGNRIVQQGPRGFTVVKEFPPQMTLEHVAPLRGAAWHNNVDLPALVERYNNAATPEEKAAAVGQFSVLEKQSQALDAEKRDVLSENDRLVARDLKIPLKPGAKVDDLTPEQAGAIRRSKEQSEIRVMVAKSVSEQKALAQASSWYMNKVWPDNLVPYDPKTANRITSGTPDEIDQMTKKGQASPVYKEQEKTIIAAKEGQAAARSIVVAAEKILKEKPGENLGNALKMAVQRGFGSNEDLAKYDALVGSQRLALAKGLQGSAQNISNLDTASVAAVLPKDTDTARAALAKLQVIDAYFENQLRANLPGRGPLIDLNSLPGIKVIQEEAMRQPGATLKAPNGLVVPSGRR